MPSVETIRPLRVAAPGTSELKISARGPNTIFYGDNAQVSSSNKIGNLAEGESLTIQTKPVWLLAEVTPALIDFEEKETLGGTAVAASAGTTYLRPSGGDDSKRLAELITPDCDILLGPGTFLWNTEVVKLPRSATGIRIRGSGREVTTIKLSTGAPRAFDFNKVADYDTFQNIELSDLTVDCNNVGGKHHVILGTYVGGVQTTRINVAHLRMRNIRTINVPVDSTVVKHRLNIFIEPESTAGSTATSVEDVEVDGMRFEGGNQGIVIAATGAEAAKCTVNEVHVRNWWHSLLAVQTENFSSANVQVGSKATVGHVSVSKGYGAYSGDVGVELDNASTAYCEDVLIDDPWTVGFNFRNFTVPTNPNEQVVQYRGCKSRKLTVKGGSHGWLINPASPVVAMGTVELDHCEWYRNETTTQTGSGFLAETAGNYQLRNCKFQWDEWPGFAGEKAVVGPRIKSEASTSTNIVFENVEIVMNGKNEEKVARKAETQGISLDGSGGTSKFTVAIDGGFINLNIEEAPLSSNIHIYFAQSSGMELRGHVRGMRFANNSDTGLDCILFSSTVSFYDPVRIEGNDFRALAAAGKETVFITEAEKSKVRMHNNIWRTKPTPVGFTALVNAAGKALATQWAAHVVFKQGSGEEITAIDYSTNNGTTYTNFLTQAAGALPAGFDQVLGPLTSDALIKVTFAKLQPTITLVPVDP